MKKAIAIAYGLVLWLVGVSAAQAQANAIEGFAVTRQGGKTVVRITPKEPLRSVPPNCIVANPARIAVDSATTRSARGRASHDTLQGELRSTNVVSGGDRT